MTRDQPGMRSTWYPPQGAFYQGYHVLNLPYVYLQQNPGYRKTEDPLRLLLLLLMPYGSFS